MRKGQVVVIGSSDATEFLEEARAIGRYIGQKGYVLISGGRGGIMEAACRGATEGGGITIGILPGESLDMANPYCSVVVPTGMGYARNAINVLSGDLIIAIGGKSGTLSELAYAWGYGKPVICCTFAGGWSARISDADIDDRNTGTLYRADSVENVLEILERIMELKKDS